MVNIAHAALTGAEIHEPKGIATAATGTVYVANGSGSGSWANVGTSSFTGMIADFTWPVVQSGWLELDGSDISTSTYSGLYSVMTIQTTGTRTNASPVITSIASTSPFKIGYYVFGTGIAAGTTIVSIDSATQITLSNNAGSSGTAAIVVSPWYLNTGTIRLPDVSTAGRYRRSRSSTTAVGQLQADSFASHSHATTVSSSSSTDPGHYHTASIYDPGHSHTTNAAANSGNSVIGAANFAVVTYANTAVINSNITGIRINSTNGLDNTYSAGAHAHTITSTASVSSVGASETRPLTLVVMTCVKT